MRIAVSADNNDGLDSIVSPHFGRCPHYVLINVAGSEIKGVSVIDNPYYGRHEPGQVPALIHSHGVNVMLTGGMGGRAIMFFQQYGIEGVTGAYGTVRQSVERYLGGQLKGAAPCKESQEHGHTIPERSAESRSEAERGADGDIPAAGEYEEDELGRLREEAEMLRQQLDEVTERLNRFQ